MLASRTVIDAIVSRLIAASTAAGSRVYGARPWPFDTLPAIRVLAGDEQLAGDEDDDITWPRTQVHTLQVEVQGAVRDVADTATAMDTLAEQVLLALQGTQAAATLSPLVGVNLIAQRIARQHTVEGEAAVAVVTVSLEANFTTLSNQPATLV